MPIGQQLGFTNFERSCKGEQSIQLRRYVVVRKDGKLFLGAVGFVSKYIM
jgi:hypothetical protein